MAGKEKSGRGLWFARGPGSRATWLLAGALLLTAAVYVQSAAFDFTYDDFAQIVYNPRVHSWKAAPANFTSHVWAQTGGLALYYRPVFMLWLTANYALFGLQPAFWHLAAIAIHLLACLLFYFFAWRLTENRWVAVVTVLLFGLHPAHVEAVAWVAGVTESLLAVLVFGSLLCYLKHRDSGKPGMTGSLACSLLLAFLAVLAKETALIFPGLIFSYEWAFHSSGDSLKRRLWSAIRAALPYIPVSLAFLVMRAIALKRVVPPHTVVDLGPVLLAWPEAIVFYIGHLLFPWHLSVFYNPLLVARPGLGNFILPLMVASASAGALYYGARRSRVFAFLALWCGILLLPMLNVTLLNNLENVHDRYLYLPSAAYCLILAMLLSRLRELRGTGSAAAVLVLISGTYIYLTAREQQYWSSDYDLSRNGVAVSPGHPIALQSLGNAYIRQGRAGEAIPLLVESLESNPTDIGTFSSLGFCYSEVNALPLADEFLTRAISLKPSDPRAHLVLGMVRLKQSRLAEAEAEIRRGLELQKRLTPGMEELFHYHLANVLYARGDLRAAMNEYQLELRNDPGFDPAVGLARERISQIKKEMAAPGN